MADPMAATWPVTPGGSFPTPSADPSPQASRPPPADELTAIQAGLESGDDEARAYALIELAQIVDGTPEGTATLMMCLKLRKRGVLQAVSALVPNVEPIIHQTCLMLLATLTTLEVDPNAPATQKLIVQYGAVPHIVQHLFSQVALTVAYACGTLQNMCDDIGGVCDVIAGAGGVERLRQVCVWHARTCTPCMYTRASD